MMSKMNGIEFLKDVDQQMLWAHMMFLVAVTSSGRFAYVQYVQHYDDLHTLCGTSWWYIHYVGHPHTVWTIQYGPYYIVVWWVHILQTFVSYQGPRETNERTTFLADREAYSNPWSSQWPSTNTQVELIDTCNDSTNISNKRDSLIRKESVNEPSWYTELVVSLVPNRVFYSIIFNRRSELNCPKVKFAPWEWNHSNTARIHHLLCGNFFIVTKFSMIS